MDYCRCEPSGGPCPRLVATRHVHVCRRRPAVPDRRNRFATSGPICRHPCAMSVIQACCLHGLCEECGRHGGISGGGIADTAGLHPALCSSVLVFCLLWLFFCFCLFAEVLFPTKCRDTVQAIPLSAACMRREVLLATAFDGYIELPTGLRGHVTTWASG